MRSLLLSGLVASSLFATTSSAQTISLIARTGNPAPGMPQTSSFQIFRDLSLGDSGQITFIAGLSPTSTVEGVWTYQNGALQKVAVMGEVPPPQGLVGSSPLWSRIDDVALNGQGQLAILGAYSSSSGQKTGIWTGSPGALSLLAVDGAPAPGVPGATLGVSRQTLSIDESGRIPFAANLRSLLGSGIWVGTPGNISLVVRQGDPAPGTAAGVTFGSFATPPADQPPPAFEGGRLGIASSLTGTNITTNDYGLWTASGGVVSKVAVEGDSAPPGGRFSAVAFLGPNILGTFGYSMNASGRVAFLGTLDDGREGIWLKDDSGVHNLVLQGQAAPGNLAFLNFWAPRMNSSGQIVFQGDISDGNRAHRALWLWDAGQLRQIASGLNDRQFDDLDEQYAINDAGQITFISLGDGRALWEVDSTGGLHRIASLGCTQLASGQEVCANYLSFLSNQSNGSPFFFNNAGQILFRMELSDGTEGIFLSSVPEPAAILLLPCLSIMLRRRLRSWQQ